LIERAVGIALALNRVGNMPATLGSKAARQRQLSARVPASGSVRWRTE
jgi:hypothetical protein